VLIHIVDAMQDISAIKKNVFLIENEIAQYDSKILDKPRLLVFNKIDEIDDQKIEVLKKEYHANNPLFISALLRENIDELLKNIIYQLSIIPPLKDQEVTLGGYKEYNLDSKEKLFFVLKKDNYYEVGGEGLYKIYQRINTSTTEGVDYLINILHEIGVEKELLKIGVQPGDNIKIFDFEFDYV
jgi:GTP-binding protein